MATLSDLLRTGYKPPTESALADPIKEHFKNLPQTTQANLLQQRQDIDNALQMTPQGAVIANQDAFGRVMSEVPNMAALTAWHGTPHKILGKFDISKVGTGEGAQAYGHGMYFAENPNVATGYKSKLGESEMLFAGKPVTEYGVTERIKTHNTNDFKDPLEQALSKVYKDAKRDAIDYPESLNDPNFMKDIVDNNLHYLSHEKSGKALDEFIKKNGYPEFDVGGNLYKVDIPDEQIPNMLDWDKPISQQSDLVKNALLNHPEVQKYLAEGEAKRIAMNTAQPARLEKLSQIANKVFDENRISGQQVIDRLNQVIGDPKKVSEMLNELGIKGIKYLDEGSRSAKQGSSNFVVFDPSTVKILEENSKPVSRKELIEKQVKSLKE